MSRSPTGPANTPAPGEAPAGTVVRARAPREREPAAERAAAAILSGLSQAAFRSFAAKPGA